MSASNPHAENAQARKPVSDGPVAGVHRGGPAGYPQAVTHLIDELARLPGIGRRSAERLALHLLRSEAGVSASLSCAIGAVKASVRSCEVCFSLSERPRCAVCQNVQRDHATVLVVEQPRDLLAMEQTGMYRGVYHVLLGRLSPLDGVGPADLTIADLFERLDAPDKNSQGTRVREVILGLNPTLEGDATALFLSEPLRARGVRVSRLARGLPTGTSLEVVSKAVLADAIAGRREVG